MKRVALVIGHLSHGGSEKQLYLLSKYMNKQKYQPVVFCLSQTSEPWGLKIETEGVRVVYIPRLSRFDITRVLRLAFYLYRFGIDTVVTMLHIGLVYGFLARALYFKKCRFIVQIRSREPAMKGMKYKLNRRALSAADHIVVNSKYLINFVADFFKQPRTKIDVIYNGMELSQYPIVNKRKDRLPIRIGIIGKDTYEKNIDLFIQTGIQLLKFDTELIFHLCGRNLGHQNRFRGRIDSSVKDRFVFHDEIENVSSFLANLDIYLSTSRSEGLPNAIMEAMWVGLPVVATDVGGVSELVIDGKTGFLVESEACDSIVDRCRILIKDDSLRVRMGKQGQEFIRSHFAVKNMVSGLENIIDDIKENG